jgi:pyruvate ferredoxin oxidoreductase alpha subunit
LKEALAGIKDVAVIDRACSFGLEGPVGSEIKSIMGNGTGSNVYGFIAGIGGREIKPASVESVFRKIIDGKADPVKANWVEVRND